MKTKPRIAILLAFIMVGVCLVSPTMAVIQPTQTEYGLNNTVEHKGVTSFHESTALGIGYTNIEFKEMNTGTVDFTVRYDDNSTVTGQVFIQEGTGCALGFCLFDGYYNLTIGSMTRSQRGHAPKIQDITYATNDTDEYGLCLFDSQYAINVNQATGGINPGIAFEPHVLGHIVEIEVTSDVPIDITTASDSYDFIDTKSGGTNLSPLEFALWLASQLGVIGDVLYALWYWFGLIFIANIKMVFALYFTGTGAYAMMKSRDPFQFLSKWFKAQKAFWEFMIDFVYKVVGVVGGIIQALLKWL